MLPFIAPRHVILVSVNHTKNFISRHRHFFSSFTRTHAHTCSHTSSPLAHLYTQLFTQIHTHTNTRELCALCVLSSHHLIYISVNRQNNSQDQPASQLTHQTTKQPTNLPAAKSKHTRLFAVIPSNKNVHNMKETTMTKNMRKKQTNKQQKR